MSMKGTLRAVARLNLEERQHLRNYIGDHTNQVPQKACLLTPEESTQQSNTALDAVTEDLSQAEFDDMTATMTGKYIEPSVICD